MKKSKGASWRYTPKVSRAWLDEEAGNPEQPTEEAEGSTESARVEPPRGARVEIEQLSERVRNLGEMTSAAEAAYTPEIKAEPEIHVPASEPGFNLPEEAAEPVFTPPAAYVFTPPAALDYVKPQIPVQPAFQPKIPAVPSTQRIAERLAQQRRETAPAQVPAVKPPTPVSISRPFYPESYVAPASPKPPVARPAFLEVQEAPRAAVEPRPPVVTPPLEAARATAAIPVPPAPPAPVIEKIAASEVSEAVPIEKFATPAPPSAPTATTAPAPVGIGTEIPAAVKFDPVLPLRPGFEEVAQPTPPTPARTRIEAAAPTRTEEARKQQAAETPRTEAVKQMPCEASRPAAPPREESPRPKLAAPQPAPRREADGETTSGLSRVLSAVRTAIPVMQRLLPLFEGNVAKAVSNLLAPLPRTAIPAAQEKVDIAPVERGLLELNRQHRELREQMATQNVSLQRVEDQLAQVRSATDRNTLEQQELIEEMQSMAKRQSRFATLMLILLLLSLAANVLLYLQFRH